MLFYKRLGLTSVQINMIQIMHVQCKFVCERLKYQILLDLVVPDMLKALYQSITTILFWKLLREMLH